MSDKSELRYGIDVATRVLHDLKKLNPGKARLCDHIENYFNSLPSLPANIFLFSLSEEGNLLSQWRGYTMKNRGISIGFEWPKLKERAAAKGLQLNKVLYDYPEQYQAIMAAAGSAVDNYRGGHEDFEAYFEDYRQVLIMNLSLIKNEAFKEEKEYRLVSQLYSQEDHPDIQYRAGKEFIIPFIEIDIANLHDDGTLFKEVYLGPHDYSEVAFFSIRNFLSSRKACFSVLNSMIPLR